MHADNFGTLWHNFITWVVKLFVSHCVCDVDIASTGTPQMKRLESAAMEDQKAASPQTVIDLENPLALNACLREPLGHHKGDCTYKEHVVRLTHKIIRAYCNAFHRQTFYVNHSSGCNHDDPVMQSHCSNGVQDPQGTMTAAILMLRMIYPEHWAFDHAKYGFNDRVLCVALISFAFKTHTCLQSTSSKHPAYKPGFVLKELIHQMFGSHEPCTLDEVKRIEGRFLTGPVNIFAICMENPLALAERELEELFQKGTLKARSQQSVLRGMFAFFLMGAMLNDKEDVLEQMGTWARAEEIAKGLVSVSMACYAAGTGSRYLHPYGPRVDRVACKFAVEASKGPVGYMRVGPYSIGTAASTSWSSAVRDAVSRRCLRAAVDLFSESCV